MTELAGQGASRPKGGRRLYKSVLLIVLAILIGGCDQSAQVDPPNSGTPSVGLKALAEFPVGVAVPAGKADNSLLGSPQRQAIVATHFNSLTAENIMKMGYLQPDRGSFHFADADALVAHAKAQGMIVHGHALVWHNQAPLWMDEFAGSPDEFRAVLRAHIETVASHFAGQLQSWDVVNEAFTDDDVSTYRDTSWYRNLGADYIEFAFRTAHAADPEADLYYNDYNLSGSNGPQKLDRVLVMLDDFLARGVPIDGIGLQMHIDSDRPSLQDIHQSIARIVDRGVKVRLSELDVSLNRTRLHTELTPELANEQRQRYADVVRLYLDTVPPAQRGGITVWGITDGDSWIPGFHQRVDWPLLFNADFSNKPALAGFAESLRAAEGQ
jgi:endo-1,4-beta-xylanase